MIIKKDWLVAMKIMISDLRSILKAMGEDDSFDDEYCIRKLDNILENIELKLKN